MCTCNRRSFSVGLVLLPFALVGCQRQTEGPEEIHYGREACTMCGMIISDPHYAAEIRGGPDGALVKFDDVGDAVNWLEKQPWRNDQLKEFWVMDYDTGTKWLDARKAFYQSGVSSPMGHGYGAHETQQEAASDYATMRTAVLKKGLSSLSLPSRKVLA